MFMKVKLPVRHFALLHVILSQLTIENTRMNDIIISQIKLAAFIELRKIFIDIAIKHFNAPDKKVSKEIPDSYALLFFASYNGIHITGYEKVVINDFCRQIEDQLYKSGKYVFPNQLAL
jgi:hypothetical protein